MNNVLHIQSSNGVCFNVRIVREGDTYGFNNCLTHDKPEALVEFYDHRYNHTPLGQFVGRYYAYTLFQHEPDLGLDLNCGIPSWSVDAAAMRQVNAWIKTELWGERANICEGHHKDEYSGRVFCCDCGLSTCPCGKPHNSEVNA